MIRLPDEGAGSYDGQVAGGVPDRHQMPLRGAFDLTFVRSITFSRYPESVIDY